MEDTIFSDANNQKNLDNNSLEAVIYNTIKENILNLSIQPGEKMSEMKIARAMNCSRSPVRDAFRQLHHQGFLEIRPQIGTFVPLIDLEEAEKSRFIRESLEFSVLKDGVRKSAFDNYYEYIQDIINLQTKLYESGQYLEFNKLDYTFHSFFCSAVNRPFVSDYLGNYEVNYSRLRFVAIRFDPFPKVTIEQHQEILDALRSKDILRIEKATSTHLHNMYRVVGLCKNDVRKYMTPEFSDSLLEKLMNH